MWLLDRTAGFLAALCSAFDVTPESVLKHKRARLADNTGTYYFALCRAMGTLIRRP